VATYNEQLQRIWHLFEEKHGHVPSLPREAVQWGVSLGMIRIPDVEAYNAMKSDQQPIQMVFDFRDDVEERRYWDINKAA